MKTLHELASKLQEYIIRSQQDAHNQTNMNITKYNNLKLKMDTKIHYPHVVVCIGISEATFNIADGTKTDGGLGPDEKYVRKWLGGSNIISDLKEINVAMFDLIKAEDEDKSISMEGESDEAKADAPKKNTHKPKTIDDLLPNEIAPDEIEGEIEGEELISQEEALEHRNFENSDNDNEPETVEGIKKNLQSYIKSMFRRK